TFGVSQAQLLGLAASLEQNSTHILAGALMAYAKKHHVVAMTASQVKEVPGRGTAGVVSGSKILVGSHNWLHEQKVTHLDQLTYVRATDILVARNGRLIGAVSFRDTIREETPRTLKQLRKLGLGRVIMLTGDSQVVADRIADQLGIRSVYAECLPADKLRIMKGLPAKQRPVGMVGDGINDAPTLAASDVGIALGARGATAASESADVVIMKDDLSRVVEAVVISRQTIKIARQSIGIGIGVSTILMLIAGFYGIPAVTGALLQEGLDVAVILNALRARQGMK
ncbi:MAG: HAD-IC family P-type ATPase, partial [bacterium]